MTLLRSFLRHDDGLETIEYAILGGLIAAGTVTTVVSIAAWMSTRLAALQTALGA